MFNFLVGSLGSFQIFYKVEHFLSDPLGDRVPVKLRPTNSTIYSIDWIPAYAGTYDLNVTYGNVIPVWGSPMKLKVYDSTKVRLLTTNEKPVVGERYVVKGMCTNLEDS